MNYCTISFSGLIVDTYLGDDGNTYATLTSFADGLEIDRQSVKDWVKRHNKTEGIKVQVGRNRATAMAYPVDVVGDFLDYRVSLGDKQALALYSATFRADLERSIKEANGIQVTAVQHEERRVTIRQELIDHLLAAYEPKTWLKDAVIDEAGLTEEERVIAKNLAYIKDKEALIARSSNKEDIDYWTRGIAYMNRLNEQVRAKAMC